MNSNDSCPRARRSNDRVDGAGGDRGRPLRSLKFYTIKDVAEMLGVSGRTVCRWIIVLALAVRMIVWMACHRTCLGGDAVSDAPNEEREAAAVATLGARVPPDVLDDPLMFLPEVERATRLSATTIWRREAAANFLRGIGMANSRRWFKGEIVAYLESLRANAAGSHEGQRGAVPARCALVLT